MTANVRGIASFAQWWWPGNWLRIVYSVCVDQRWYWQHIRPQLHGRSGALIMFQAALGSVVCFLVLALPPLALVFVTGQAARQREVLDILLWCLALTLVNGLLIRVVQGNTAGVPYIVASGVGIGLVASLSISVALLANAWAPALREPFGAIRPTLEIHLVSILGPAIGLYGGICRVVIDGAAMRWTGGELHLPGSEARRRELLAGWLLAIVLAAPAGVLDSWRFGPDVFWLYAGLFCPLIGALSGYHLGASWASRQVPDHEQRKRLAMPEQLPPLWDETADELSASSSAGRH